MGILLEMGLLQGDTAPATFPDTFPIVRPSPPAPAIAPAPAAGTFDGPSSLDAAIAALSACTEVSLDVETTALTPWSPPITVGTSQKIDGMTIKAYQRSHAGCTVDVTPRARVLSFQTLGARGGRCFAFDLDLLTPDDRTGLAAAFSGKCWVGHNLQFDLQFMITLDPSVRPVFMLDTYLLATTHMPALEVVVRDFLDGGAGWRGSKLASLLATAPEGVVAALRGIIAKRFGALGSEPRGVPLALLSAVFLREPLDKSFQKPHNWAVSHLTPRHHGYCVGDITQPPLIARLLLGLERFTDIAAVRATIERSDGGKAYLTFVQAVRGLAVMQRTGLRVDHDTAAAYATAQGAEFDRRFDKAAVALPGLADLRQSVADCSMAAVFKTALAAVLTAATGLAPDVSESGEPVLDAKSLKMRYPALPSLGDYFAAGGAARRGKMCEAYAALTDRHDRIHALTSISTVTGRTSSQSPNLQNAPRGQDFRAIYRAAPGNSIVAIDYSAIEMRVAAALTARAYATAHAYASGGTPFTPGWLGDLREMMTGGSVERLPRPVDGDPIDRWRDHYRAEIASAYCDVAPGRLRLADAFRAGLDPHLITAVETERAAGRLDTGGLSGLEYVKIQIHTDLASLKAAMRGPRQAAKAQNFGLLYGMQPAALHAYGITNYGLGWSVAEAVFAAQAWFAAYPEIRLWHLVTRFQSFKKFSAGKLFFSTTLSGRPVCATQLPAVLNYQDQGTAAEIALSVFDRLDRAGLIGYLVNFIHDEFVFEVPTAQAAAISGRASTLMFEAADAVLSGFGVSSAVEAETGDFWIH